MVDETTLNTMLAELLNKTRYDWSVKDESHCLKNTKDRIDILIIENDWPNIIVECKIGKKYEDVGKRFASKFKDGGGAPQIIFEVKYDEIFQKIDADETIVKQKLRDSELSFCAHYNTRTRFPIEGWLTGTVNDLSIAIQYGRETLQYEQGTEILNDALVSSTKIMKKLHSRTLSKISKIVAQEQSDQTFAMASLILAGALQFHDIAAAPNGIRVLGEIRFGDVIDIHELQKLWEEILEEDYFAIFNSAKSILSVLPEQKAADIIEILHKANSELAAKKLGNSPDLFGQAFQRVIPDRKKLAAYYTLPASAALMAAIIIPAKMPDLKKKSIKDVRIADFACGTGTLLQAAYKRLAVEYEYDTGETMQKLHSHIMENCIIGADVLPIATHLTALGLSNIYPSKLYKHTCIYQPEQGTDNHKIGSLEWIKNDAKLVPTEYRITGTGLQSEKSAPAHNLFDIVVMNPPYTRSKGPGGRKDKTDKQQLFTAFNATHEDQIKMGKRASKLFSNITKKGEVAKNYCVNKQAGLATFFFDLAHAKLGGGVVFVLSCQ